MSISRTAITPSASAAWWARGASEDDEHAGEELHRGVASRLAERFHDALAHRRRLLLGQRGAERSLRHGVVELTEREDGLEPHGLVGILEPARENLDQGRVLETAQRAIGPRPDLGPIVRGEAGEVPVRRCAGLLAREDLAHQIGGKGGVRHRESERGREKGEERDEPKSHRGDSSAYPRAAGRMSQTEESKEIGGLCPRRSTGRPPARAVADDPPRP